MAGAAAGAAQAGGVQQINVCGGSDETSGADLWGRGTPSRGC